MFFRNLGLGDRIINTLADNKNCPPFTKYCLDLLKHEHKSHFNKTQRDDEEVFKPYLDKLITLKSQALIFKG